MQRCMQLLVVLTFALSMFVSVNADETKPGDALVMVVMDPLAKPLSCPCVAGYAQRDYEKLVAVLKEQLHREIKLIFNESLVAALQKDGLERADIVIGKQSVILHDAKAMNLELKKIAMLTGKDGLTTQRGLFVVAAADPAKQISDLKDYRIFFGPRECDEKHAVALQLLKEQGIASPAELETAVACDEGAIKVLDLAANNQRGCAVISSYAKPLLEGCGQVPKGALRVIGETAEVPFIVAFVSASLDSDLQTAIHEGLVKSTAADFALRSALETKRGFVAVEEPTERVAKKK